MPSSEETPAWHDLYAGIRRDKGCAANVPVPKSETRHLLEAVNERTIPRKVRVLISGNLSVHEISGKVEKRFGKNFQNKNYRKVKYRLNQIDSVEISTLSIYNGITIRMNSGVAL